MYKLMIVDDEPLVREYLKLHVSQHHLDWEVADEAMDGQEAWEKLQQQRVDLVITDIKMPVVDGIELCRRLSQSENPPIILILSGFDEFSMAQGAIRYGVHSYLLKPVVKDELIEVIKQITDQLERISREELAFRAMKNVSKDSQNQVVKQFLRALVSDSSVEIKALYPLVFRMKVQLIETEGMIMVLDLDEDQLAQKGIPFSDISIFRFILNQIVSELSEEDGGMGFVFLDEEQNTCVLMTGEDKNHIKSKCQYLYERVSNVMLTNTGVTVSGALGSFESELFHLQTSYQIASKTLHYRLFVEEPTLFDELALNGELQRLTLLDHTLSSIQFALLDHNEIVYSMAINQYVDKMEACNVSSILKFGIYLIRKLAKGTKEHRGEVLERAFRHLQKSCQPMSVEWTVESTLILFRETLVFFASGRTEETNPVNEQDIVSRVKAYIYANYTEPLSLALLAEKLGISSGYLSQIFHKTVQESYIKFLTRVRMEQAAKLLKAVPPVKVYDVSDKVGYVSVKHFSHVFKQHYNMPPGEFQEKHMGVQRVQRVLD
ncbi:response regulator [Paenibacillus sp. V4I5]|uniref:response regulator transcription factor n=1 Tax=Paenibacillus sp. V4I5 TaxID=3042306 RepID=UPI0027909F5F|nr:response regulator [Paenibacillus sp. V4I5]MDQ0920962.1 two-component system response regulator YesN [Paenibacillus sp. V4I5]